MSRLDHPSTTLEAPVGRCYVCDDVVPKARMVCIGPDKNNEGRYIFRCDDCYAGSPKWIKFYMHRSALRTLYETTVEAQRAKEDSGQDRREARKAEAKPAKAKSKGRVATPAKVARGKGGPKVGGRRKERSPRNVVIRRSRRSKVRG